MRRRRPDGTLEAEVLGALWSLDRPATPGEVREQIATSLAYTSIATTLGRLCDKGLVSRQRHGRTYVYQAVSEVELTSQRIREILAAASDRETALTGFAAALDTDDADRLAQILDERS